MVEFEPDWKLLGWLGKKKYATGGFLPDHGPPTMKDFEDMALKKTTYDKLFGKTSTKFFGNEVIDMAASYKTVTEEAQQEEAEFLARQLQNHVPVVNYVYDYCPVEDSACLLNAPKRTYFRRPQTVSNLIIHLNDTHQWTREGIADWLEQVAVTYDLDLSIRTEPWFFDENKEEPQCPDCGQYILPGLPAARLHIMSGPHQRSVHYYNRWVTQYLGFA